ncbi:hypothetical protein ABZ951_04285 [Streptomyces sp. NPDC046215]|uniref:Uncharacterized protein n=1 Tax=Streptomyces stramineus TaxID=173861 RepID=A0ABP3JJB6_9ACTN
MKTLARRTRRPKGYKLSLELAGDLADRFPELDVPELPEPVVLVVELGQARGLDIGQLLHDLHRPRQATAVIAHESRGGERVVRVLDLPVLRHSVAESAQAGRMYRLERAILHIGR